MNIKSITQETTLQEFLVTAELANTEFRTEKENIRLVDPATEGLISEAEEKALAEMQETNKIHLCVPRRPYWDLYTSP